jgi:CDP-diacylglycerol--glycerol-3-phosphate 3-phosphatidyltransferase
MRVIILPTVATSAVPAPLAKLPNALTVLRLVVIPIFIVLVARAPDAHSWPAAILFAAAAVTDQIDGWLARRWQVESEFGKFADPLADRLLIDSAVLLLCIKDRLPWVALALIVGRDLLLIVGTRVFVPRGYEFSVSTLGKAATWVLYTSLGCLMVTWPSDRWPLVLFWTGLGLALAAGILYVLAAKEVLRR